MQKPTNDFFLIKLNKFITINENSNLLFTLRKSPY